MTVTFHYAYRSRILGVDRNGRILAVFVTASVPILSRSNLDTFTLVQGGVFVFQDQAQIFLVTFFLTPFSYYYFCT